MTSEPPPLSGRGGDQPDIELKELIAAQQDLGEDFTDLAGWQVPDVHPPAILRIRAVDFKEQMRGLRARYWMTSYDDKSGELLAIGWKDGLRVVSEVVDLRDRDDRIARRKAGTTSVLGRRLTHLGRRLRLVPSLTNLQRRR